MSRLLFCNDVCRALYYRVAKKNKKCQGFALLASQQHRCGLCGESVEKRKRVKIVEV